jgi:hypothetical protein
MYSPSRIGAASLDPLTDRLSCTVDVSPPLDKKWVEPLGAGVEAYVTDRGRLDEAEDDDGKGAAEVVVVLALVIAVVLVVVEGVVGIGGGTTSCCKEAMPTGCCFRLCSMKSSLLSTVRSMASTEDGP